MSELIRELGALAGLAGVVGLALLAALYVAQARDVKRLRDWAGAAPERSASRLTVVPEPPPIATRPVARLAPPRRSPSGPAATGTRPVAIALVALLVLAGGAAVYGVAQLISDGGGDHPGDARASREDASARTPTRDSAVVEPADVTVAVLNGTTVPGLAAALRDQIAAAGFKKGIINDFSDQQLAASVVQYAPDHEAEAAAVGRRFGISRRELVTDTSRALAGDATVIVIAGADKAP